MICVHLHWWNISICRFMCAHTQVDSWCLKWKCVEWKATLPLQTQTDLSGPAVSGYNMPPWKCREYISCLQPVAKRKHRFKLMSKLLQDVFVFVSEQSVLPALIRFQEDKPPDETVKSSKHISHYRLLFMALTRHDTANGFSLYFPYKLSVGYWSFCVCFLWFIAFSLDTFCELFRCFLWQLLT